MNLLVVHENIPTVGHAFNPGTYDSYTNWQVFIDWCVEQFGSPYGPKSRWSMLGGDVTIYSDSDAVLVKLGWDTMEKPR